MQSGITNIVQWILYVQSTNNYSHGRGQINVSVLFALFAYNYSLCICADSVAQASGKCSRKVLRASGKHLNAQAQEATPTFLRMTGVVTKRTKAQSEYLVLLTAYE